MENLDYILSLWEKSGYPTPKAIFGESDGKLYLTVSDLSSIYFFVSRRGRSYKTYAVPRSKVQLIKENGIPKYIIENPRAIQVISCENPVFEIDKFVIEKIANRLF